MSAVDGGRKGTVVVGVDGSAVSRHALAFAADEGRRHGALLRIVGVDDTTEDAWLIAHGGPGYLYQERRDAFESMAREAVRETLLEAADSDAVTVEIVAGSPADALVRAATDADLLVVGSRGHGGFTGLLLGSVSQQCVQHARCPVTVVPLPPAARHPHAQADQADHEAPIAPLY